MARFHTNIFKDGAYFCCCAYVLCISCKILGVLWVVHAFVAAHTFCASHARYSGSCGWCMLLLLRIRSVHLMQDTRGPVGGACFCCCAYVLCISCKILGVLWVVHAFVAAHTFCASHARYSGSCGWCMLLLLRIRSVHLMQDTRVSYGWCMLLCGLKL